MFGWPWFNRPTPSIRHQRAEAMKAVREAEYDNDDRRLGQARMKLAEITHAQLRQELGK